MYTENVVPSLQFDPPIDVPASVLGIEAEFKEHVQWFSTIPSALSKGNNYIDAKLRTENPAVRIQFDFPFTWIF